MSKYSRDNGCVLVRGYAFPSIFLDFLSFERFAKLYRARTFCLSLVLTLDATEVYTCCSYGGMKQEVLFRVAIKNTFLSNDRCKFIHSRSAMTVSTKKK